jgi:proteasome lid subunit RPN8/RPN11
MPNVEIESNLPVLEVPSRVLNEMWAHARETFPEECCGLVSGDDQVRFRRLHRCRNEMTRMNEQDPVRHPVDGEQAFHMNPLDQKAAIEEARARGEWVTAVYHSHPVQGVYFSMLDQEHAAEFQDDADFRDAAHIVVSVHGDPKAGLFERSAEGFAGRAIVPQAL